MKSKAVVFGMGEKFFRYRRDIFKNYDVVAIVDNDKQKSSGGGTYKWSARV